MDVIKRSHPINLILWCENSTSDKQKRLPTHNGRLRLYSTPIDSRNSQGQQSWKIRVLETRNRFIIEILFGVRHYITIHIDKQ